MPLLDTDIAKFQKLYLNRFGVELNYEAAYAQLSLLVLQLRHTYRPITREQLRDHLNRRGGIIEA
jgi:hypothetical protein